MKCVDAAVGVKWVIPEEYTDRATALVRQTTSADDVLIAPPLLPSENAS